MRSILTLHIDSGHPMNMVGSIFGQIAKYIEPSLLGWIGLLHFRRAGQNWRNARQGM